MERLEARGGRGRRLGRPAGDEEGALEAYRAHPGGPLDEHLADLRRRRRGLRAEHRRVHRHAPPAGRRQALGGQRRADDPARRVTCGPIGRQEDGADRETRGIHGDARVAGQGPDEVQGRREGDAGPVAGPRVRGDGPAMGQRGERLEGHGDDAAGAPSGPARLGDEADPARVVLEAGIVKGRVGDRRQSGLGAARSVHPGGLHGDAWPSPHGGRPNVPGHPGAISTATARPGANPVAPRLPLRTVRKPSPARHRAAARPGRTIASPMTSRPAARLRVLVAAPLPADVGSVASVLGAAGYEVLPAYRADAAIARLVADRPDLLVVDPAIGDGPPADLIARLGGYSDSPLLVLADVVDEAVVGAALDAGAVDVVGRPIRPLELLARLGAAARRGAPAAAAQGVLPDGLRIDMARREASVTGRRVALTPTEFDLLAALAARRGGVVDHRLLVRAAWPDPAAVDVETLRTHLARLNVKLIETGHPGLRNVRARGYAVRVEGSDAPRA